MPRFNSPEAEARWRAAVEGRTGKRGPYKKKDQEIDLEEENGVSRKFSREFYLDAADACEECGLSPYTFRKIIKELGIGNKKGDGAATYFTARDIIRIRTFKQLMDDLEMGVADTLKVQRATKKMKERKAAREGLKASSEAGEDDQSRV